MFVKGLARHNPVLAGLIAQRIAEAFLDRPGAHFAFLVDGQKAHLKSLGFGFALQDALEKIQIPTRVQSAIERLRPRLRKLSCAIELESIDEAAVRIRLAIASHSCGSSAKDIRTIVEDTVYEHAPDITTLTLLGLDEPAPTGFVSLESLLGQQIAATPPSAQPEKIA